MEENKLYNETYPYKVDWTKVTKFSDLALICNDMLILRFSETKYNALTEEQKQFLVRE